MSAIPSDKVLLTTRPSRLLSTHHYILVLLLLILALLILAGAIPSNVLGQSLRYAGAGFLAIIALLLLLVSELRRLSHRYTVYEHRVATSEGILSKRTQYMPYSRIERIEVDQSIIGRIFGIGNIVVDTGDDQVTLRAIRKPGTVEQLISQLIRGPRDNDRRTR